MSGFDRIKVPDPGGRRLAQADGETDPEGRAALFTPPDAAVGAAPATSGGGVTVVCSRCGETTALDAATAVRSALPLFLVAPWRSHPLFAVCPACGRRSWLRPGR